jgi:Peptidase family C25
VRLTYWHSLVADNNQLRFPVSGKQAATVDGFSSAAIRVFDVTSVNAVQEVMATVRQTKAGYAVSVNMPATGQRTLLAMTNDLAKRVSNAWANQPSNWRNPAQAGSLVLITRRDFFSALQPLVNFRAGQGYKVALVDVEDIYDEFSYGNKTAQAIKDFLAYAASSWQVRPGFVLFAADASYDPKNYLGFGDSDLVPTKLIDTQLMETASDDWLADLNSDGLADMAIGRLPVRTAREASALAAKIVAYEQIARPDGTLLVTDDTEEFDFEAPSRELRRLIPAGTRTEEINRGRIDAAAARSMLLSLLNKGQRIVNYNGHANVDGWRGNLLNSDDAASLSNGDNLSLFVMMTCLNGYFLDAQLDSLAESLMKAERGGAVAVWASSGMTGPGDQAPMGLEVFRRLFDSNSTLTLGEVTARAKGASKNRDVRLTWILFGDPTTRLKP